jgi:hypothetical protein
MCKISHGETVSLDVEFVKTEENGAVRYYWNQKDMHVRRLLYSDAAQSSMYCVCALAYAHVY